MATKDITDAQVVQACIDAKATFWAVWPYDLLQERTGQCLKVCWRAMERAADRGYLNYGVSLRTAWAEPKGIELLSRGAMSHGLGE